MEFQLRIENFDKFLAKLSQSPKIMAKHLQRAVDEAGNHFLSATKQNIRTSREMWKAPIDTGLMWNSIFLNVFPLRAEIFLTVDYTVDYAVYVHQGTTRMRARPFLEITERTEHAELERIFARNLNEAMEEII